MIGAAWEAGVLQALAVGGVRLDGVEVAVGTSAGAAIGSVLLLGAPPEELFDTVVGREKPVLDLTVKPANPTDAMAAVEVFTLWSQVEQMNQRQAARIAAVALRAGTISAQEWLEQFQKVPVPYWPERMLVTAVAASTGQRTVWGSGDGVDPHCAVAASCSVPGMFPPVRVGDDHFVDGGLWSMTNADVLLEHPVRTAVVLAPIGSDAGIGLTAARSLKREVAALEAAGINVEVITPAREFPMLALFDERRRFTALEAGVRDGADAVERVRALRG